MRNQSGQQLKRQILLTQRAHEMRHQLTASEAALWSQISRGQLDVTFHRQVLVGNRYIVDFLASKSPVAIVEHGLGPDHGPAGFLLNRELGA